MPGVGVPGPRPGGGGRRCLMLRPGQRGWAQDARQGQEEEARVGGWGTQLRPGLMGLGVGEMEDSIITGEGCVRRWLPARQEGTEMTAFASLEVLGAGWSLPLRKGQAGVVVGGRMGGASHPDRPLSSGLPLGTSVPLLCPGLPTPLSPPGAGCPDRDCRGGSRPRSCGWRCGGQRGRGLGGPQGGPMWPDSGTAGRSPGGLGPPVQEAPPPGPEPTAGPGSGWGRGGRPGPGLLLLLLLLNLGI